MMAPVLTGTPALDSNGVLTIKNYADTPLILPFYDENDQPRDMTGATVRLIIEGMAPIDAVSTGENHVKLLTIPATVVGDWDENRPREYAIVDMSQNVNGGEVISGIVRAKKINPSA